MSDPGARRWAIARFIVVGAAGFCVDGGLLLVLQHVSALGPIMARSVSFPVAVILTFVANRLWSFQGAASRGILLDLILYFGGQGAGFLCNFVVYSICVLLLPPPLNAPLLCLAVAAGIGLIVNYTWASRLVFRAAPHEAEKTL